MSGLSVEEHGLVKLRHLAHPWRNVVGKHYYETNLEPLPSNLLDVFLNADRSLLILGGPGAGKTTTLISLARAFITVAELDAAQPIPVIGIPLRLRSGQALATLSIPPPAKCPGLRPPAEHEGEVATDIRAIFNAANRQEAEVLLRKTVQKYASLASRLATWMEENLPEGFTVFAFPSP